MSVELLTLATGGRINPPASYSGWWWVVLAASLVALVLLWWRTWHILVERPVAATGLSVDEVRARSLAALAHVEFALARGEIDERSVLGRCSREVRGFVGIVTDGDADYSTLPRVRRLAARDPRLAPLVEFLEWLNPMLFDLTAAVDCAEALSRARQVVTGWN